MPDSITPYQIPQWVPGRLLGGSDALGWQGLIQRSYQLHAIEVVVPPVDHFAIMLQCSGAVDLQRRAGKHWVSERYRTDDLSLLSVAQESHWRWMDTLDVSHVYLSSTLLTKVAEEVTERSVASVTLRDVLVTTDPLLAGLAKAITGEAASPGLGGSIYVEALATQMAVHLLRRYSSVEYRADAKRPKLDAQRLRKIQAFVEAHLHEALCVAKLAEHVGMGPWRFSRAFKEATGCAVHQYIVCLRIKRAELLLAGADLPLRDIAAQCGFSDQAHMTRSLKSALGVTPRQLRQRVCGFGPVDLH